MNGYSLFKFDRATKLHFTTEKYNVFEYKGSVIGTSFEKFLAKRDYNVYNAVARKFDSERDAIQFLVANYAYRNDNPIHNIATSERNVTIWNKRKQSISNIFKEDIDQLALYMEKKRISKDDLFLGKNGDVPDLFKLYMGGKVTIETMHILNEMTDYLDDWKPQHSVIWSKEFLIIEKLKKFVKFDMDKLTVIYNEL